MQFSTDLHPADLNTADNIPCQQQYEFFGETLESYRSLARKSP